jgi:type IV pilus assembly protein PilE
MKRQTVGVTLIELMITVAIVAILAAVAYPSYTRYALRANRVDGKSALLRIAGAEEKFFVQSNIYSKTFGAGGLNVAGTTERGYYTIDFPTDPTAAFFEVRATAVGPQLPDTDCREFRVDSTGTKSAKNSGGTDNTLACWK